MLQQDKALSPYEIEFSRQSLAVYGAVTRGLRPAPHHEGIIRAVDPKAWNKGSVVVCPPGSGKSTWISEIAPPWMVGNHPDWLILHLHANDEKANAYVTTIQQVWESNSRHGEIFPDVQPDMERGWSTKGLYFKWRDNTGKWPIVDKDVSRRRGANASQDLKKRALAASLRTHEQQHLAAPHFERYPFDGLHGCRSCAIDHGDVPQFGRQCGCLGRGLHLPPAI